MDVLELLDRLPSSLQQVQIRKAGEDVTRQRREHRQAVVRHADVVLATLISAGGELKQLLPANMLFDTVIIDEVGLCFLNAP